jgi:hypothetical protein
MLSKMSNANIMNVQNQIAGTTHQIPDASGSICSVKLVYQPKSPNKAKKHVLKLAE